jgi:sugar phosphate isomerase/epimerase
MYPLSECSMNTATLGFNTPIRETIEATARAGFGGIAPWRREVEGQDVIAVARQIRDAGLATSGYCRSTYFPANSREEWSSNIEDNKRAMADAAILNARCFVLVAGGLPAQSRDLPAARMQIEDGIAALLEQATSLGIKLAIEPLHPMYAADRSCVNTIEQALRICDALDTKDEPCLGLAIDVYHTWWDPKFAAGVAQACRDDRLLAFHVNDWLVPTNDLLMDRGMVGDGVIDLPAACRHVRSSGYDGLFELEVFSRRLWDLPNDVVMTEAVRAFKALFDQLH